LCNKYQLQTFMFIEPTVALWGRKNRYVWLNKNEKKFISKTLDIVWEVWSVGRLCSISWKRFQNIKIISKLWIRKRFNFLKIVVQMQVDFFEGWINILLQWWHLKKLTKCWTTFKRKNLESTFVWVVFAKDIRMFNSTSFSNPFNVTLIWLQLNSTSFSNPFSLTFNFLQLKWYRRYGGSVKLDSFNKKLFGLFLTNPLLTSMEGVGSGLVRLGKVSIKHEKGDPSLDFLTTPRNHPPGFPTAVHLWLN
jgi:hypothetical protein